MECPYCKESTKDEALVCRHCGRDLNLVKPLIERIDAIEKQRSEAQTTRGEIGLPRAYVLVFAGTLCLLATTSTLWAAATPWPELSDGPYYLVGLGTPLFFGLLVGSDGRAREVPRLIGVGLVLGFMNLAAALLVLASVEGVTLNWPWILLVFIIGQTAIVASAGWIIQKLAAMPLSFRRAGDLLTDIQFIVGLLGQIAAQIVSIHSITELFP